MKKGGGLTIIIKGGKREGNKRKKGPIRNSSNRAR